MAKPDPLGSLLSRLFGERKEMDRRVQSTRIPEQRRSKYKRRAQEIDSVTPGLLGLWRYTRIKHQEEIRIRRNRSQAIARKAAHKNGR